MKRTVSLLAVMFCLCFAACSNVTKPENGAVDVTAPTEDSAPQEVELVGPWHLDSEKNDLSAFADSLDLFPGYGEWGASMEIRSNGQMGWYIGAEGWHGTYTVADGMIHGLLTSDLEQSTRLWDFRITAQKGVAVLEMDYQDMVIYWVYGDREETPAVGVPTKVYVDRQGTDTIYSSFIHVSEWQRLCY